MGTFLTSLFGKDPHSQRMRALRDIGQCHRRLSEIISMGVFDPKFDAERHTLQTALDNLCARLTHAVTYNDWWSLSNRNLSKN